MNGQPPSSLPTLAQTMIHHSDAPKNKISLRTLLPYPRAKRRAADAARLVHRSDQKEAIMEQVELVTKILFNLKQLAHQKGTDVEGVVSWLAISYNPAEAMNKLLD
jgi:hypothetical protein